MTIPITAELVAEFLEAKFEGSLLAALKQDLASFLASRQVKDWEIVSMVTSTKSEDVHDQNSLCDEMGCVPYSVRRLPSNEVFTVGEQTQEGKIEGFEIIQGQMCIRFEDRIRGFLLDLHKLPSKPVLFVSDDGNEIRPGDTWSVVYNDFSIQDNVIYYNEKIPNIKRFSTREAAEKYVKENRLQYSETMIWKALQASFANGRVIKDVFDNLEKQKP